MHESLCLGLSLQRPAGSQSHCCTRAGRQAPLGARSTPQQSSHRVPERAPGQLGKPGRSKWWTLIAPPQATGQRPGSVPSTGPRRGCGLAGRPGLFLPGSAGVGDVEGWDVRERENRATASKGFSWRPGICCRDATVPSHIRAPEAGRAGPRAHGLTCTARVKKMPASDASFFMLKSMARRTAGRARPQRSLAPPARRRLPVPRPPAAGAPALSAPSRLPPPPPPPPQPPPSWPERAGRGAECDGRSLGARWGGAEWPSWMLLAAAPYDLRPPPGRPVLLPRLLAPRPFVPLQLLLSILTPLVC